MSVPRNGELPGWNSPGQSGTAITKSDVTVYTPAFRGIYVGGAGNVAIVGPDDSAPVTYVACIVGQILWVAAKQVYSTGTTATNLVGIL